MVVDKLGMRKIVFMLSLILILVMTGCASNKNSTKLDKASDALANEKNYSTGDSKLDEAMRLVDQGNPEQAALLVSDKYDETTDYVAAKKAIKEKDYSTAQSYFAKIPDDYSGLYCNRILREKKEFKVNYIYNNACNLIKNGNYSDASLALVQFRESDSIAYNLYNYASAKESEKRKDYSMTKYYLNLISDYTGPMDQEIKSYKTNFLKQADSLIKKQEIQEAQQYEQDQKAEKARRKKEGVTLGMTKEQVLESAWGKPEDINRTITANGEHEQWCYPGGGYLYFDDGVLTAVQN